MKFRWSK